MSSACLQVQVQFGGVVLLFILGSNLGGVGPKGVFGGEEEGGGVRSGSGDYWVAGFFFLFSHVITS